MYLYKPKNLFNLKKKTSHKQTVQNFTTCEIQNATHWCIFIFIPHTITLSILQRMLSFRDFINT